MQHFPRGIHSMFLITLRVTSRVPLRSYIRAWTIFRPCHTWSLLHVIVAHPSFWRVHFRCQSPCWAHMNWFHLFWSVLWVRLLIFVLAQPLRCVVLSCYIQTFCRYIQTDVCVVYRLLCFVGSPCILNKVDPLFVCHLLFVFRFSHFSMLMLSHICVLIVSLGAPNGVSLKLSDVLVWSLGFLLCGISLLLCVQCSAAPALCCFRLWCVLFAKPNVFPLTRWSSVGPW